jgi:hypothetical protein
MRFKMYGNCRRHIQSCVCSHFLEMLRHCHYFQEVIELSDGDEIAVAQCAYGHEGDRSWREQLHVENRFVEFDTRIGHLSFVVLA